MKDRENRKWKGHEKLDLGSSIFWLAISVYICYHSVKLGLGDIRNPGPGFIFFWCGMILGILAIVVLGSTLANKRGRAGQIRGEAFEHVVYWKVIGTFLCLLFYVLLMERLGFLIATFLFITILLITIGVRKIHVVVFVALTGTFLSYAIFELWLHTRLPKGLWGI